MDESWRMRMGMPSLAGRRRASEDMTSWTMPAESGRRSGATVDADDFNDVFGGPPRSVLSRKLSCNSTSYDYFYHEIFRRSEEAPDWSRRSGRRLPEFTIPATNSKNVEGEQKEKKSSSSSSMWRSLSKSNRNSKWKSNSSSTSIQLGIREEDVALDSFASKLRPINVPCRWNSSRSNPCFSQQFPSPEAEIEYSTTVGISVDEIGELESPSSANSMFCHDTEASNVKFKFNESYEEDEEEEDDDDDFSSYVIEINSSRTREEVSNEDADIDEAIAWAKATFQASSSSGRDFRFGEERSMIPLVMEVQENVSQRYPMVPLYMQECIHNSAVQKEEDSSGEHLGTSELDERVDSWASEKHTNIRLLLSTLHHILWPSSGWNAIPLPSLIEHSQVKKAYQKARLCIHPDKLQQRGATFVQKYIAQKAFSVLQNAWDAFISQEVYFS